MNTIKTLVRYTHIRRRHNGIPSSTGGYTIASKWDHVRNKLVSVVIQCSDKSKYVKERAQGVAYRKLMRGAGITSSRFIDFSDLVEALGAKVSTGSFVPKNNLEHILALVPGSHYDEFMAAALAPKPPVKCMIAAHTMEIAA